MDTFAADKCGLDMSDGFHLQLTHGGSKLLKLSVVEEEPLAEFFHGTRIQIEVIPVVLAGSEELEGGDEDGGEVLSVGGIF